MTTISDPAPHRRNMVAKIAAQQFVPASVADAMRKVPRHLFLPGLDPDDAYLNQAVTIKPNPDGPLALSCASVPSMVALMLTQLDLHPGQRVLEIGAGTGYNAALLAELVGPKGSVTTIDVDPGVALYARDRLSETGYQHVTVMERDGLLGAPENGPYDRIIATVGMWDLPQSWWDQLTPDGQIVVPLRWRGQSRSLALQRTTDPVVGDHLRATSSQLSGFIPFVGQNGEQVTSLLDDTIRLHHDIDQRICPTALSATFTQPPVGVWTDVTVDAEEPFDGIWLQATAHDDRVCRIEVTTQAILNGVRAPVIPIRSVAVVEGSSLAYLIADTTGRRLGAAGYGPEADRLAKALAAHITAWGRNRGLIPALAVRPRERAGANDAGSHDEQHGRSIIKDDCVLIFD